MRSIGLSVAACCFAFPAMADGQDQARTVGPAPLMPVECQRDYGPGTTCYGPRETIRTTLPLTETTAVVAASTTQGFDFSGFDGGVGAAVSGGFVGGGGTVIIVREARRFSGVRSTALGRAALTGKLGGNGY